MIFHKLRLINKNQLGFTLFELLIALAISGVITGAITSSIIQVITGNLRTSNHMTAVRQVQDAGYWVSYDAHMAQEEPAIVNNGDGELESITLTWTKWDTGEVHQVAYTLEGAGEVRELWRDDNGQRSLVARFIDPDPAKTSCVWDDDVHTLTFTVTATVGAGSAQEQSETRVYKIVPRAGA